MAHEHSHEHNHETDTITQFMKAAQVLQQDNRYLELERARKANDENAELQKMLDDFNDVRQELNSEIAKAERDADKVAELNTKINDLYNGIMNTETMQEYNDAKEDIKDLINFINAIITAAVDGEDPMKVEPPYASCGADGCASCAGCG